MVFGVSVEELEEAALGFDSQNREYACVVRSIIAECKELDPWLPIDDFLSYAETQGYKGFCQLRKKDGEVIMGWFSSSYGMFYQCFPTGFEPLMQGTLIGAVLPLGKFGVR